jgi:Ca2+-binding RTX toxin-like protein
MRDMGGQQNTTPYATMASQGFHFDFFAPSDPYALSPTAYAQWLATFASAHPGAITSIEGANEVNNWPITYNGSTSLASEAAYQQAMYNAVKGNSVISSIPVFNLSMGLGYASGYTPLGNMSSAVDYGNVHAYMSYGNQPNVQLNTLISYAQAVTPGKPMAITESGYPTLASDTNQGVDQATQAKLTLNLIMDAEKLGDPLFIYELIDNTDSGGGAWNYGGLFNGDWSAKPAATAIHNLTTVLTTGQGDTVAAAPTYTVSGLNGYHDSMVVHESNGTYDIVVWDEPTIWNSTTHSEVAAPTQTATINLGTAVGSYSVYDPLSGTTAVASGGSTSQISVQVTDHPVIVELHGAAPAPTPPPPPTTTTTPPTTTTGTIIPAPAAPTTSPDHTINVATNGTAWGYGNDVINCGSGNDTVYGGSGNDTVNCGSGYDRVYGKQGYNTLNAGTGHDDFVFDTALSNSFDVINHFNTSLDKIYLDHNIFTGLATGALASSAFYVGAGPHAAADRVIYNPGTGDLMFDPDGSGSHSAQVFAHLSPGLTNLGSSLFVF